MFEVFLQSDNDAVMFSAIAGIITAIVLGVTLAITSLHNRHQTKMDTVNFYSDFDSKLRDSVYQLKSMYYDDDKVYSHMIRIIMTLSIIIEARDELKLNFRLSFFTEWFKFGLALVPYLDDHRQDKKKKPGKGAVQSKKTLDFGDEEFSKALIIWCKRNGISLKEDEKVLPRCVTDRTYLEIKSQFDTSS